jgi:hypothetical protein
MALPDPQRLGASTLGRALHAAASGVRMNPWLVIRDAITRYRNNRPIE